jgi:hypothetical protein
MKYYEGLPLKELMRLADCEDNPLAYALASKLWELDPKIQEAIDESEEEFDTSGAVQEAYEKIELGLSHLPREALSGHVEEALDELQEKLKLKQNKKTKISLIHIINQN